jgi:hypothetical protein
MVACLLAFDLPTRVSLYRVGINESRAQGFPAIAEELVVGLNNSSLRYEKHLERDGSLRLDASVLTTYPERDDINSVIVPASILAEAALATSSEKCTGLDNQELVGAVMLGAVLGVLDERPETGELKKLFLRFHQPPVLPFVLATCTDYDWVQDRQMRGKSLTVGVEQ